MRGKNVAKAVACGFLDLASVARTDGWRWIDALPTFAEGFLIGWAVFGFRDWWIRHRDQDEPGPYPPVPVGRGGVRESGGEVEAG
ncbi:MAG: hypothetical protein HOY69_16295 [Streptomyces sp.]|nr:hypothetical protein [Streptomyces sp.]